MHHRTVKPPLLHLVDRGAAGIIIAAMAGMVTVVSLQVLLRYAFNTSLDWAEDIARLAFVWAIFLGIPLGVRSGAHIGIELLTVHFPPGLQRAAVRLSALLGAALMAVAAWYAARLVGEQWDEMLPTLDVTAALFMIPVAFGMAHSTLHLLLIAYTGEAPRMQGLAE